jgi:putative ABC transport system substrate-binding protein
MRRRDFIEAIAALGAAWPVAARAQQARRMRQIGILLGSSASDQENRRRIDALKQALQDMGWNDTNTSFEPRFAEGELDRLPVLATELVNLRVDVIVTGGTEVAQAAHNATATIPIVMAVIGDAVGVGLASSLAHPGGNVTGLTLVATDQGTKRLELIKEAMPNLARVAVFWNPHNASQTLQLSSLHLAASKLSLQLQSLPIGDSNELNAAFDLAVKADAQAIVTMEDALISFLRKRIIELAMRHMLPVIGEFSTMAADGALMSYAPNQMDMWRSAARFIDKILKGANPADLPIEQPTKFELVINLKTAKALGLTISNQMQLLADEVIE